MIDVRNMAYKWLQQNLTTHFELLKKHEWLRNAGVDWPPRLCDFAPLN